MSTRSHIARLNKDGSVDSVYCHWDGYPEYNGLILSRYYDNPADIDDLIELGDISVLRPRLFPTGEHTFENPEENVTIFYGRDRGDEGMEAHHYATLADWEEEICGENSWIEFGYLWNGECWRYCSCCTREYADIPD